MEISFLFVNATLHQTFLFQDIRKLEQKYLCDEKCITQDQLCKGRLEIKKINYSLIILYLLGESKAMEQF